MHAERSYGTSTEPSMRLPITAITTGAFLANSETSPEYMNLKTSALLTGSSMDSNLFCISPRHCQAVMRDPLPCLARSPIFFLVSGFLTTISLQG